MIDVTSPGEELRRRGAKPAPQPELHATCREGETAAAFSDLGGVSPALLALAVGADACGVGDTELHRERVQDGAGHICRVIEKGAEKSGRGQLQRVAKTTAVAPLVDDPVEIVVVKMKVARQLLGGEGVRVTALAFPLIGCQEVDGHRGSKCFRAKRRWCDDPSTADVHALQEPGAVVAGDQVVGVAADGHRQQKRVEGVVSFDVGRQAVQHQSAL